MEHPDTPLGTSGYEPPDLYVFVSLVFGMVHYGSIDKMMSL